MTAILKAFFLSFTIVIILFNNSFAQSNSTSIEQEIDSILQSINQIDTDLNKVITLTSFAGRNRYATPTRQLINKAIELSEKNKTPLLLAHAYYSLGNFYFYQSKMDSCLLYLKKSEQHLAHENAAMLQSSVLVTKGGVYSKLGAVILSISTYMEAQEYLDKVDTLQLAEIEQKKYKGKNLVLNNSLANLYSKTEDYDNAFNYYNKAITAALSLEATGNAAIILGNKGDLLIKMNRSKEALEVLHQSKKMLEESHFPKRFMATNFLTQGIAYFKLGRTEEALKFYEKSLAIGNANNLATTIMRAKAERGILMIQQKKFDKALLDCTTSKKTAQETNDTDYLIKSCNCLYQAQTALGNYQAALNNHEQYTAIKDSVYNETNIRKITQVGMQYDFDKKDAQQQLIIEKKNREKNQFRLALVGVALLLFGVYLFYRNKLKYQKTINLRNQELQEQKIKELRQKSKLAVLSSMIEGQEAERLRIAKDLHDSLGGLLSTIKIYFTKITKFNNNIPPSSLNLKTSELIDEACIEVRRISHNMMPHALSISGLKGAIEDLGIQLQEQGFQTTVEINQLPDNIDSTKQIVIYRLIQEIISNIRKHAKAKNILIQLIAHNNELNLSIEDDGVGFDYKASIKKDGLGLKSINSRVDFLDGKIEWDSQLNKGTTLTINIPL